MKLTDLALIFIGILLPIIIVVYVNVSYTIKSEEQEMYYEKLVNSAAQDAADQMKQVENDDNQIDYGYSGESDKKVNINAQVAVNTFLDSLYNNFGIKGNRSAEAYFQVFVPAIAVFDYNGLYVSSLETYDSASGKVTEHVLKPKRYYSYTYYIKADGTLQETRPADTQLKEIHTVEFTMDDYITHRGSHKEGANWIDYPVKSFYVADTKNNGDLNSTGNIDTVVSHLKEQRTKVIVNTVTQEMSYAVNANNSYARAAGITYSFAFPTTTSDELYQAIDRIGVMAFVQGINVGNRYLNTKTYGVTKLDLVNRYYLSSPSASSKYKINLYHKDTKCPEYLVSYPMINSEKNQKISPRYTITKQHAASVEATVSIENGDTVKEKVVRGFYPCPICNP